ncbi:hypothetical protein T484DRAFT_1787083, partial [Baffinella frigidus]
EKGIHYRCHPANVDVLQAAAIDVSTLANNHLLDWGAAGLEETVRTLDDAGVKHAGAGASHFQAWTPASVPPPPPSTGRLLVFAVGMDSAGVSPRWAAGEEGEGRPGVAAGRVDAATAHKMVARVKEEKRAGDIVPGGNWRFGVECGMQAFASLDLI